MFVEPKLLDASKRPKQPGEINFGHQTLFVGPPTRARTVVQREDSTGGAAATGDGAPGKRSSPTAPQATARPQEGGDVPKRVGWLSLKSLSTPQDDDRGSQRISQRPPPVSF